MRGFLSAIRVLHGRYVLERRFRVLADLLAERLSPDAAVLDVGCGPGTIGHLIRQRRPSINIRGLEVAARPKCLIEFDLFDGETFPHPDGAVDVCLLVDVLHHTHRIEHILRECCRVSRRYVLIKDHLSENWFDNGVLKFMDWVGNRPHGVALPYNYLSGTGWQAAFRACQLRVTWWSTDVPLYPFPFNLLFGRQLHFVALLEKESAAMMRKPDVAA